MALRSLLLRIPEVLLEELSSDNLGNEDLANKVLVGYIRSAKIYNVKAVKDILVKAWASTPRVHITELGKNMFLFCFSKEVDAIEILRRCPWFVMNHLLCLEKWNPQVACNEIVFNKAPFWIQIHQLPLANLNLQNATKFLGKVGEVLEIENPIVGGKILRNYIRGRVKLNLDVPFPTRCWIPRRNLPNNWVVYKYERLQSLCYKCGIIGHDQKNCSYKLTRSTADPSRPKYGPEIYVNAPQDPLLSLGKNRVLKIHKILLALMRR